jgi:hypothetical protein
VRGIERSPTTFELQIKPREASAWPPVDRHIPMKMLAPSSEFKLPAAAPGRHWLLYGFDKAGADQLREVQKQFTELQQRKLGGGGTIGFGIEQQWISENYPKLRDSDLETWLRLDRHEGFFKLWSGRIRDLEKDKSFTPE